MSSRQKRLRPLPDADSSYDGDEDCQIASKYARCRHRSRVPARAGRPGLTNNTWAGTGNIMAGVKDASINSVPGGRAEGSQRKIKTAVRTSGGSLASSWNSRQDRRSSQGSAQGRSRPGSSTRRNGDGKKWPMEVQSPYRPMVKTPKGKSPACFKRKQPGTPREDKKRPGPFNAETPEFMKVKEDESLLIVKKERKRKRNKVMSMRTAKGQPLMRGRIQLMLDDIKQSMKNEGNIS